MSEYNKGWWAGFAWGAFLGVDALIGIGLVFSLLDK